MIAKSKEFARDFFVNFPGHLFCQLTRMDKHCFFHLVQLVEAHLVLHNHSFHFQTLVECQLAIKLNGLGHDGNGSFLNHMILTWGVHNGSIVSFTKQCSSVLEDALAEEMVWLDSRERVSISMDFGKFGFPQCIGLIDGSLLPIVQWPKTYGECYWNQKCRYSLNKQVVCDHRRKILFLSIRMSRSCQDLTYLRKCPFWPFVNEIGPNTCFNDEEYLLDNSSYMPCPTWSLPSNKPIQTHIKKTSTLALLSAT